MSVGVEPITDADIAAVADFLHRHLNSRISAADWARSIRLPWQMDAPNHGFLLRDGGDIVGVHLAFYSLRELDGRPERICNLGAWCVMPGYRSQGLRLLLTLLAQVGYHFTDLSPSGSVVPLNERLKFRRLDPTATALVPGLPWPVRGAVVTDPARIEPMLDGTDLQLYRDHRNAPAARHLVLKQGDNSCYVMYRRDRYKRVPLFATILHVGNPDVFQRTTRLLARHLLMHHGLVGILAELRVVGHRPRPSLLLSRPPRPRMFRSSYLRPDQIDYCYSELVCVAW